MGYLKMRPSRNPGTCHLVPVLAAGVRGPAGRAPFHPPPKVLPPLWRGPVTGGGTLALPFACPRLASLCVPASSLWDWFQTLESTSSPGAQGEAGTERS